MLAKRREDVWKNVYVYGDMAEDVPENTKLPRRQRPRFDRWYSGQEVTELRDNFLPAVKKTAGGAEKEISGKEIVEVKENVKDEVRVEGKGIKATP